MIKVVLDEYQKLIAEQYGIARAKSFVAHFNGKTNTNYEQQKHGGDFDQFIDRQVAAVAAELAVAEYLGFTDFVPKNDVYKDEADVGTNIEVKYTHLMTGNLLIRKRDRDSDYGVLVIGDLNAFYIVGFISVKEAKTIQSDYDLQSDNEDKIIEEIKRFLLYYVVNLKMEDLDNLAFATLMDLFNVVAATATGKKK